MRSLPMPWGIVVVCATFGTVGGAIFGFVRGLRYLPTLPFAIVEGAVLIGVPAAMVGLLLSGVWWLGSTRRRVRRPRAAQP